MSAPLFKESLKDLGLALKIFKTINFKLGIALCYKSFGDVYSNNNFTESIQNYYAALQLYREIGDIEQIVGCLTSIGFAYYYQENLEQSFKAYSEALKLCKENGFDSTYNAQQSYVYIANIYRIQKNYSDDLSYDSMGLNIFSTN